MIMKIFFRWCSQFPFSKIFYIVLAVKKSAAFVMFVWLPDFQTSLSQEAVALAEKLILFTVVEKKASMKTHMYRSNAPNTCKSSKQVVQITDVL